MGFWFLVPGAFLSDLRASKLWYNSLLILTMDVRNFEKLKGVPKKIQSMFFEAGVKNQNFKLDPIALKFCMGLQGTYTNSFCFLDHIDLGLYSKVTAILKKKMAIFWKLSPNKKIVTAQKSFKICFYIILGGQKNFLIFQKKIFGTPFRKKVFPKG